MGMTNTAMTPSQAEALALTISRSIEFFLDLNIRRAPELQVRWNADGTADLEDLNAQVAALAEREGTTTSYAFKRLEIHHHERTGQIDLRGTIGFADRPVYSLTDRHCQLFIGRKGGLTTYRDARKAGHNRGVRVIGFSALIYCWQY